MENNEGPFEAAVQGEATLITRQARRRKRSSSRASLESDLAVSRASSSDSERSPLLSARTSSDGSESGSPDRQDHVPWTSGFEGMPWYKRPSIFWLLPAFLPFTLAFGGIIVPKVNLILTLLCKDYLSERALQDPNFTFLPVMFGSDNPQCRIPEVQARVAKFQLYANLISGIFAALVTPHLGALSDRWGRKKIITYAAFGAFVNEIITIVIGTHPGAISVWWLLVGMFFDGLCGSFTASIAICYSYAADCTAPERRNVAFGYFHGVFFMGIAFGPVLAGYLVKWAGNIMVVFYIALGCHIYFISFLNLFVPESLTMERQMAAREKHKKKMEDPDYSTWQSTLANYNFFEPLGILWPRGPGSSAVVRRNLVMLATIDTLCFGVGMGTMNIIIIYAEYVFGWGNLESSAFLSASNICRVISLLVILPGVTRLVRGKSGSRPDAHHGADNLDLYIIRVAILFELVGYIGYASATSGTVMLISGMIASFGGIASPSMQSALTKHIPADRTGQLLGAMGLLHALARIVAPTIFNSIYAKTVGHFTQAVFVCLASVFVLAEFISWFLRTGVCLPSDYQTPHIAVEDRDRRYLLHRASSAVFEGIRRMSSSSTSKNRQGLY